MSVVEVLFGGVKARSHRWTTPAARIYSSSNDAVPVRVYRTDASVFESSGEVLRPDFTPIVDRPAAWLGQAVDRLSDLIERSEVRSRDALEAFIQLLIEDGGIWSGAPAPFLAPLADGGVSIEFEGGGVELVLEIHSTGAVTAYTFDQHTEWEGPLPLVPDGIEKWAWRLSQK